MTSDVSPEKLEWMRWGKAPRREAERLGADVVMLADVSLSDEAERVRKGTVHPLTRDDLARQSYVASLIDGGSLLDVGMGRGVMVNLCGLSGRFDRVVGADIKDYRPDVLADWESVSCSVEALPFTDGEFDTVTAMEIIEHLPDIDTALHELRRVAARTIVTVPFCEHPPLWRGHLQRFCADRLRDTFPDATFTVLVKKAGTAWVLADIRR